MDAINFGYEFADWQEQNKSGISKAVELRKSEAVPSKWLRLWFSRNSWDVLESVFQKVVQGISMLQRSRTVNLGWCARLANPDRCENTLHEI
ncbi:hypothetical protein HNY73_005795 [Argiope bruennichi]|uniref:Uncharacterized protein n=1 Tax=Argiope bruennichi TaxID=94029 RepID=A0A8T0FKD6_ARGBR|nr:hypothetical protein HNY73_005795 [Argiope bruennichi]